MLTRRSWLTLTSLLTLESLSPALARAESPAGPPKLLLVPLGPELPDSDIDFVKRCLLAFYDFQIEIHPRESLPKAAYYAPRKRYRAEKLLKFLDALGPAQVTRVLGLTALDISTTKGQVFDWGILGLATIDGKVGVLSSHRCARGTKTPLDARVRFGKVAVHELGHTLGLLHCPTASCLMEDAQGSVMTTDREYDLCPTCRTALAASGHAARANPPIPWPEPAR